ncbi:MAG: hypothetical protein V1919_03685 [Candidatus Omnitrophota bacterium]
MIIRIGLLKIGSVLILASSLFLAVKLSYAQNNTEEVSSKAIFEATKLIITKGELVIKQEELFLVDADNKIFKILPELNPSVYSQLFSQLKDNLAQKKGARAEILGQVGQRHSIIHENLRPLPDGTSRKSEAERMDYFDFNIVKIISTQPSVQKEIKLTYSYKRDKKPEITPPLLQSVQGKVVGVYLKNVIPYFEVIPIGRDEKVVILLSSHIKLLKAFEGQLMELEPKSNLKIGLKVEVWFEEQGNINLAKSITILSK